MHFLKHMPGLCKPQGGFLPEPGASANSALGLGQKAYLPCWGNIPERGRIPERGPAYWLFFTVLAENRQLGRENCHHGVLTEMPREYKNGHKRAQGTQRSRETRSGMADFEISAFCGNGFEPKEEVSISAMDQATLRTGLRLVAG
jgi:hypothetical protein